MAGIKGQPEVTPRALPNPVPANGVGFESLGSAPIPKAAPAQEAAAPTDGDGSGAGVGFDSLDTPAATGQPGMMAKGLDVGLRGLDYPGGLVRTSVAALAGAAGPKDLENALVGKAPNSAEYLRRLGVSEGGSLDLPVIGRTTLRGAEGLALDVLSDPLTLIAKSIKQVPYLAKLLETPGKATEALGEAVYKSAVTAKNSESAATAGKALIEQGAPVATASQMVQKISDAANTMGKLRAGLYDRFAQLGGALDMPSDMFKRAQGVIATLRKNPNLAEMADGFQEMIDKYRGAGFVDMPTMSTWKTQLYDSLPKSAFTGARLTNPGKMFKAALAQDFKTAIVNAGDKVEKGLGQAIDVINDKWGALLEAKPTQGLGGGSLGKQIDAVALIAGGIPTYVKKKALEVATGPLGRTVVGKALMAAGQTDVANQLFRQAAKNYEIPQGQGQ